jgi:WD40 repeat protein
MKINTLIAILFLSVLFSNAFADIITIPIRTFIGHTDLVWSVSFSPDGQYALSGSFDKTLKLWDVNSGVEIHSFRGHTDAVRSVAFSPDGRYALSGSDDSMIKRWDVNSGAEIRSFRGHTSAVYSVAFSPDGRYALSGSNNKTFKLWEVNSGVEIRSFRGHTSHVWSVAFSPDGRYALSGSTDETLKLWDVNNGAEIRSFSGHTSYVRSVAFSPNGQYALSGSDDQTLKLWDVNSGAEIRTFRGHSDNVRSVAFSPNGQYALSGSPDKMLKLWDVNSGAEIHTFRGHTHFVLSVAFSPDGRYALSGSEDQTLKLWDTGLGSPLPPANVPPTAAFFISTTHGEAPLTVTLDASSSTDSDGTIVSYAWTANGQHFASSNVVTNTFNPGKYTIILTITDNQGLTATTQQHLSVTAPNQAPIARFAVTPTQGQAPLTVTLNGSASTDPDGTIAWYSWWASDGQTALGVTATMTFQQPGTYTINLGVGDNVGVANTNTAQQTVTVTEAPKPPVANFTALPTQGQAPLTVNFDASGSHDPEGAIVSYEWSAGGPPFATGKTISNTFTPGDYTITLTVKDNQGLTATAQHLSVTVNQAPIAQFTITPIQGQVPLTVNLDASTSTDDSIITQYNWSASDGQTASGKNVVMTFPNAGTYTVNLVVTDDKGAPSTNSAQQTVTVIPKPVPKIPPVATLIVFPKNGAAPLTVNLDGSQSIDSDGNIIEHAWTASDGQQTSGGNQQITFANAGTYTIALTVTDNDGLTATAQDTVTVTVPIEPTSGQAIIIAAGGAQPDNTLFKYSNDFVQRMYRLLKEGGFSDTAIHYMNPYAPDIDVNGYPDDGQLDENRRDYPLFDPAQELPQAFANAASNLKAGQQFVFYLHGHAEQDEFLITPSYPLSALYLRDLLATLPTGVTQIIILDSCYSGSFFDELKGVEGRILISSGRSDVYLEY